MSVLLLLLLLVGFLLSRRLVPDATPAERAAWTGLWTLAGAPIIAFQLALLRGVFLGADEVGLVAVVVLVASLWRAQPRALTLPRRDDWIAFGLAALAFVGIAGHHHHADFLIGVASYLGTGETECFYMQTFSLFEPLNPGRENPAMDVLFGIASSPGNTAFTTPLLSILGPGTFRFVHAAFAALLALFTWSILRRWGLRPAVAGAWTLAAVFNPGVLFIEVLDRNFIALVLSLALFHALCFLPRRHLLHGLLFGLCAGAGLRFLGLLYVVPMLLLKAPWRPTQKSWLILVGGFFAAFAFNLPHLPHHGLHSLGETSSVVDLAVEAARWGRRTPFLPLNVGPYYVVQAVGSLGLMWIALVFAGAAKGLEERPRQVVAALLFLVLPLLVLSTQRDWLQVDKTRIGVAGYLPLLLLPALAMQARLRVLLISLGLALVVGVTAARLAGPVDPTAYARHPVFQRETPAWAEHARAHFAKLSVLPDFGRLFLKSEHARKRVEEQVVADRLFPRTDTPVHRWLFGDRRLELPEARLGGDFVDLCIDLDKLVTDPDGALCEGGAPLVDLSDPEGRLDVHFKQARVSWQDELVGVAVLPGSEIEALGELYIELNALTSFGQDDLGFEQVDVVSHAVPVRPSAAPPSALTALPWPEQGPTVVVRVPADLRVLVRWWLVDGVTGQPHRVESWSLEGGRAVFHPLEPESYL